MEKIGLLEDINKSKSNPDVRHREKDQDNHSASNLMVGRKGEEKTAGKQVIKMINT